MISPFFRFNIFTDPLKCFQTFLILYFTTHTNVRFQPKVAQYHMYKTNKNTLKSFLFLSVGLPQIKPLLACF